jgi:hypothetical protein
MQHLALMFINVDMNLPVDPAFGCLHCVEVGCVAIISEEHPASIIVLSPVHLKTTM